MKNYNAELNKMLNEMEKIWICVYRDTVEEHDEVNNLTDVQVTKEFAKQFYNTFTDEAKESFGSFENFLNEYTADDTEEFYQYAMKHNAVLDIEHW